MVVNICKILGVFEGKPGGNYLSACLAKMSLSAKIRNHCKGVLNCSLFRELEADVNHPDSVLQPSHTQLQSSETERSFDNASTLGLVFGLRPDHHFATAIPDHTSSTSPNGHEPCRKP